MPVKIRLSRRGRKKKPIYSIVVADSRAPRDGRFIERIGQYNPNTHPQAITLDDDRALCRLMNGAQPTETVRSILSTCGVLFRKHLKEGVKKKALTQEQADQKYEKWAMERGGIAAQILRKKQLKRESEVQKEREKIRKAIQKEQEEKKDKLDTIDE